MSELPTRRKSPEELARLRESLGGPDRRSAATPPAGGPPAAPPVGPPEPASAPVAGAGPKPVRSLRRAERVPAPRPRPAATTPPRSAGSGHGLGSPLPVVRHSAEELAGLRARNAAEAKPPVEQIASLAAHPALLGCGYVLALAGGVGGLLVALFLWLRKPRSHHHAAFIAIIAVLVITFAILYLLPKSDAA
jgi:hypothetical protein